MTTVLFAIDNVEEQDRFRRTINAQQLDIHMLVPDTVGDVDRMITTQGVDIIVTDFRFQKGGFAEWLYLWQHPFVLIADWNEYERVGRIVIDQTSDFVIRDSEGRYIDYLPLVIRKILNNKESIEQHNVNLRMTEERYRELVQALPDIIYTLDAEGKIVFINDSIRKLGWEPMDLIGQHFSVLLDPEYVDQVSRQVVLARYRGKTTGAVKAPKLFDERRTGDRRTADLEVKLRRKTSVPGSNELFGAVIAYGEVNAVGFQVFGDGLGEPGTVGIIRDITQRKESERIIRRSLREKETLLAEIHHRVKNNLQVISSLLNLQAGEVEDTSARERFGDAQMQIQSMALVHEHLYQSDDLGAVDVPLYIRSLCEQLWEVYAVSHNRIALELDIEPVAVDIAQAMPMALLLNELVTNSLKYAFPNGAKGTVSIVIRQVGEGCAQLTVRDDGVGMPADFDISVGTSLGQTLIQSLAMQLSGTLEMPQSGGATFSLTFPLNATADDS